MTATISRPKRNAKGVCTQCNAHPMSFHKPTCSCLELGHEWQTALWDPTEEATECAWCGKVGPFLTYGNDPASGMELGPIK